MGLSFGFLYGLNRPVIKFKLTSRKVVAAMLVSLVFLLFSKANITIAETNTNYKKYISIIRLSRKISEDKGMSA